jgi:hypothetical protein
MEKKLTGVQISKNGGDVLFDLLSRDILTPRKGRLTENLDGCMHA